MTCRIAGKSSGPDLAGLLRQISKDPAFCSSLLPAGYIQFGKGPDFDYDPVCFDERRGFAGSLRSITRKFSAITA
jgi:hypothetical protein